MSLITALCIIFTCKNYPAFIVWQSILLIGWIVIQIVLRREINFLQIIIGFFGIALFTFGNRLNI